VAPAASIFSFKGHALVGREVVHDDGAAGPQFGHQDLRHVGFEPVAVDRSCKIRNLPDEAVHEMYDQAEISSNG